MPDPLTSVVVAVMIVAAAILVRASFSSRRLPYAARDTLLTPAEVRFYRALRGAAADDWTIFAMVRLADLLAVESPLPRGRAWFQKIAAKHIDFVLCDPLDLRPIAALELDDSSHESPKRLDRDAFVDEAFRSAGLPLLRFAVAERYDPDELRNQLDEAID